MTTPLRLTTASSPRALYFASFAWSCILCSNVKAQGDQIPVFLTVHTRAAVVAYVRDIGTYAVRARRANLRFLPHLRTSRLVGQRPSILTTSIRIRTKWQARLRLFAPRCAHEALLRFVCRLATGLARSRAPLSTPWTSTTLSFLVFPDENERRVELVFQQPSRL